MAVSFLHGRWRRIASTSVALIFSIASVTSPKAANGQDVSNSPDQQRGRAILREAELDDKAHYPGLTFAKPGNSTTTVRKQAVAQFPMDQLSAKAQKKSQSVLGNLGMFRKLPTITFECDPDVYRYFLKNPDVAVSTWRAMGISQFQLQQNENGQYRADAGDGSVGDVEILLQTPTETLIHCEGAFKSPLLPKPIIARSLMHLQTSFASQSDGKVIGTHTGEVFVEFPSHTVEAVAKVISPVSHVIADRNFKQMTLFVHLMSQTMSKNPAWIEQTGQKLEGVSKEKKLEFLDVATRCYLESRKRQAIVTAGQSFTPDEVLMPYRQLNSETNGAGFVPSPTQTANQVSPASLKK